MKVLFLQEQPEVLERLDHPGLPIQALAVRAISPAKLPTNYTAYLNGPATPWPFPWAACIADCRASMASQLLN